MSYVNHGSRHRLKGLGGSDPFSPSLPMCIATTSGVGDQLVNTSAEELIFSTSGSYTNDPNTFRLDPADPSGILVYTPGIYLCLATVRTADITVAKTIYQQAQPLSSGAGLFGNELGFPGGFTLGTGQGAAGIGVAPGPSGVGKSEVAHICLASMGSRTDPSRYTVALVRSGTDWSVRGSAGGAVSVIVKLSDYFYRAIPAPPA